MSLLTSQPAENPEVKVDFRLTKHQFTNRSPKTSTLNGLEGKSIDFYIKYGGFPVIFPLNPLNQSIETPMKNRTPLPRIGKWRIIPLEAQPWLGGGHNRILCDSPWVIHEYLPGWYTYPSEKYESVGIIIPSIWEKMFQTTNQSFNISFNILQFGDSFPSGYGMGIGALNFMCTRRTAQPHLHRPIRRWGIGPRQWWQGHSGIWS